MTTKYDVGMDTVFRFRIRSDDKALLFAAAPSEASSSDFWRNLMMDMSEKLTQLQKEELSPESFGEWMRDFAEAYIVVTSGKDRRFSQDEVERLKREVAGEFGSWRQMFAGELLKKIEWEERIRTSMEEPEE